MIRHDSYPGEGNRRGMCLEQGTCRRLIMFYFSNQEVGLLVCFCFLQIVCVFSTLGIYNSQYKIEKEKKNHDFKLNPEGRAATGQGSGSREQFLGWGKLEHAYLRATVPVTAMRRQPGLLQVNGFEREKK